MTKSTFEVINVVVKPRVRITRTGTRYETVEEILDGKHDDPTIVGRYIDYPDYWEVGGGPLLTADFDAGADENRSGLVYRTHEFILGQAISINTGTGHEGYARFFYPDYISPTEENGIIVDVGRVYWDLMSQDYTVYHKKTFKITGIYNGVRPAIVNMPHSQHFAIIVGKTDGTSRWLFAIIYDYDGNYVKQVDLSGKTSLRENCKHVLAGFEDPEHYEFLHVFGLSFTKGSYVAITQHIINWWTVDNHDVSIETPLLDIDEYSTSTHFDAALIGNLPETYKALITVDTSSIGASRVYMYDYRLGRSMRNPGPALSAELSPYPFDDMDWTGALTIYGLHRAEKTGRVFLWMSSRVKNSDSSYSTPVFRLLSTSDGIIWRKEAYCSTTEYAVPARPIFQGDQLLLVSGASIIRMHIPWQMRMNSYMPNAGYVRDIAGYIDTVEINHEVGKPSVVNLRLADISFLEADAPVGDYDNELVIGGLEVDVSANNDEPLSVGSVVKLAPDYANDGGMLSDSYTGYGPLDAVSSYSRILDEEIVPSIELHDSEALVNLDNSIAVWDEDNQYLVSEQPNGYGEFFLFAGTPLNSEKFGLSVMVNVGEAVSTFGLVWFAGDPEAFNMNETATQTHSRLIFQIGKNASPLMYRRVKGKDDFIETAPPFEFPTNEWVRLDMQTGNNFGRALIAIVRDERTPEFVTENLDYTRLIGMNRENDPRYNRRRWLAGIYAYMPFCKTSKFHFDSDTEIEVEDASSMPDTGEITIANRTLSYKKDGNKLVIGKEIGEPLVAGYRIIPSNAKIKIKYFDASTGQMRYSLDESISHLVNAAGFEYEPTQITKNDISQYDVIDGAAFLDPNTGWYYTASKRFSVRTDIQAAHFVAEMPIMLNFNACFAEISFGLNANNYAGYAARIRMVDRDWGDGHVMRYGLIAVGKYDADNNYFAEKRIVFTKTNLVDDIISEEEEFIHGIWKIVVLHGWVHFYLDAFYLGSIYWEPIENLFGSIAFGGGNTLEHWPDVMKFKPLRIYSGLDAFYPGIWDNGVTARDMMRRFLIGRQVQVVEREDGVITLERQYMDRNKPKIIIDDYMLNYSVAHDTFNPASILIIEGQEEWYTVVSPEIMKYIGEKEMKVNSPYLVTREQIYAFGFEELQRSLDSMMQANLIYPPSDNLHLMSLFRFSTDTMQSFPKPFDKVGAFIILSKKVTLTNGSDVNTPLIMTQLGGHAYKYGVI